MKKIAILIGLVAVLSTIISAKEVNYVCIITAVHNLKNNVVRKFTNSESKKTVFGFRFDRSNLKIIDTSGEVWKYVRTNDDVDYYKGKSDKTYFLIGKTNKKYLKSGIFMKEKNVVMKAICKEQ